MTPTLSRFLGRLSVGRKLLLIYLLDLSAVFFISGILINEKFIAIDFARKEVEGNAYVAALRAPLLEAAGLRLNGVTPARAVADEVRNAETKHGAAMGSAEPAHAFAARLEALARADVASRPAAQRAAIDRGRELITRIGNQSNLILDPDLDSYYAMSTVVLRLPELLDVGAAIEAHLRQAAVGSRRVPEGDARTQYFILEGQLDAIGKGLDADYGEAFAAARDPRLRAALEPLQTGLRSSLERFRAASRAELDGHVAGADFAALDLAQQGLLAQLGSTWRESSVQLERLLDERIAGLFERMWLHLGTALFLLMMLLSAVFYVARQISLPLKRLLGVVDEVGRTGNHALRAHWASRDEIGRLVVGFNGMLEQLDRERQVQQDLAASARAAAAQQELVEAIPIPLVVTAVPGHEVLHANEPAQRWLGGRSADPWAEGVDPPVRARFFQQLQDRGGVSEFEVRWKGGKEPAWAVLSASRLAFHGRDAVLTAFTPINRMKAMEQRLELWAKVFEASSEAIVILDAARRIVSVNAAFQRSTGHEPGEVIGKGPQTLLSEDESLAFGAAFWSLLEQRGAWQGEVWLRRRQGGSYPAWLVVSTVRDGKGAVTHTICTSLDISERKASEERIQFLAHHDVLTGLPNRSLCTERMRLALQQAERNGQQVAVLFIDLDNFKTINDSLGHHVGDQLLRSVARRLQDAIRGGDTVSRLGGDEFVVVLTGFKDGAEVLSIVEHRLMPLIRQPHDIDGAELHVSCSVGIALYPDDARDLDELLRHADVAMYQAKAGGRDGARFFTPELNERAQLRLTLESNLRRAIERQELVLHYQPRVAAAGAHPLVSVEALLRWESSELGSVSPANFIPIAEESKLIMPIGAWVVEQACAQQARWRDEGLGVIPVSVNLSAVQLRDASLLPTLSAALRRHGIEPSTLELELTESSVMESGAATLEKLEALKAIGVKLSIDDFGTGYSSLEYLNRFPIDRLKIDRSFVREMLADSTASAITRAIIGLGHTLGLRVVAEGVETLVQAEALRTAGCDELQGYYFARPMLPERLAEWLGQRTEAAVEAAEQGSDLAN